MRKGCWVKNSKIKLTFLSTIRLSSPMIIISSCCCCLHRLRSHHHHSVIHTLIRAPSNADARCCHLTSPLPVECIFTVMASPPPRRRTLPSSTTVATVKLHLRLCRLTTTLSLFIAAPIERLCHPPLPPLLLTSIARVKRWRPPQPPTVAGVKCHLRLATASS